MREVTLKVNGWKVIIESNQSRYETLENVMLLAGAYLMDSGRKETLENILQILKYRMSSP